MITFILSYDNNLEISSITARLTDPASSNSVTDQQLENLNKELGKIMLLAKSMKMKCNWRHIPTYRNIIHDLVSKWFSPYVSVKFVDEVPVDATEGDL